MVQGNNCSRSEWETYWFRLRTISRNVAAASTLTPRFRSFRFVRNEHSRWPVRVSYAAGNYKDVVIRI
jgi:hypothetical protein